MRSLRRTVCLLTIASVVASWVPPMLAQENAPTGGCQLNIEQVDVLHVAVSWSTNAVGFELQSATSLAVANWDAFTNVPGIVGTNFSLTIETDGGQRFFRLAHTNLQSLPNHANLTKLDNWKRTLLESNRPFHLLYWSDQTFFPEDIIGQFHALLGTEGGRMAGGGWVGQIYIAWSNATPDSPFVFPREFISSDSSRWINLTNGAGIYWSRYGAQPYVFADRGHVIYLKWPYGGTFTVETNVNGAGWGTWRVIDSFQAGETNLVSTNLTLPTGLYQMRAVSTSGTNRISNGGLWSSTNRTLHVTIMDVRHGSTFYSFQMMTNVFEPLIRALEPDLILMHDTSTNVGKFPELEWAFTNASPNADVIYCGQPFMPGFTNPASCGVAAITNENIAQRAFAVSRDRGWFDMAYWIPDVATGEYWIEIGLSHVDGSHLSAAGSRFLSDRLWDAMTEGEDFFTPHPSAPPRAGTISEALLEDSAAPAGNYSSGRWSPGEKVLRSLWVPQRRGD